MKLLLQNGRLLLPLAIIGFGIINVVTGHFPTAFMPVIENKLLQGTLVYGCAMLFVGSGAGMMLNKFERPCALAITVFFFIDLCYPQLTTALQQPGNASQWTVTLEILALCSGTAVWSGLPRVQRIARYAFAVALAGFAVLHYLYADYIVTLIPAWMPAHYVLNALVLIGFAGTAVCLVINRFTRLANTLLGCMFVIWVLTLHLPRCLASPSKEPEWSSGCIALAMAGIGFVLASRTRQDISLSSVMGNR